MRLLQLDDGSSFTLADFAEDEVPCYAILSHTWGRDGEEVTHKDIVDGTGNGKAGYDKLRFCAIQAKNDGLGYCWIDTCCIDKTNAAELTESINSMFRWYQKAAKCYVFLADVSTPASDDDRDSQLRKSRWFTRGWTLQELIAPRCVEFFSQQGERLGDRKSLERKIHQITSISIHALRGEPLSHFPIDERMSWAANRTTKRPEDKIYSLLGIFDIHMEAIYGEGEHHASRRLLRELERYSENHQLSELFHDRLKVSPSKQPKTPLVNPTWIVPFERDPCFTSREPVGWLEQTLGQDSEYKFNSKHGLGLALYRQNKQSEAEEVLRQAVRRREQTLGQDHEYTLNSKHWLGLALYQQKKDSEAEEVLRQAARGREQTLGQDHKYTLNSKHWLGLALCRRKKYSEAEEMLRQAVRGREQTPGQDYKETLYSKHKLGEALYRQKKYSEAEEMLRQAVRGREQTLGQDHKETLNSKYWLGRTLFDQQKYSGAEGLFQQLADQQERTLGRDHQHTLATVRLLQELRINSPPPLPVSNTS
jgi:TolA-binding protein